MSRLIRRSLSIIVLLRSCLLLRRLPRHPASRKSLPTQPFRASTSTRRRFPQLQRLMDRDRLTSAQLTRFYLSRIKRLNPALHAVITVSPTALADARAADRARNRGDDRPLLGIPIIVKDNINTTGMPTTAGSWALAGSSPRDAFIVKRLRAAGAIIIGKANLSEWANFRSIPSSSGWSGIGGQTNMAYVLDRNPCGSSSGSGVVASADLAVAAVGTETDGSIVCPSGANARRGNQADSRPSQSRWDRPDLGRPGHRRPDDPECDRCGRPARRDDRRRSKGFGDSRRSAATPSATTPNSSTRTRSAERGSASGGKGRTRSMAFPSTPTSTRSCRT